jgi:AcrR family transcriptional regulator
LGSAAEVIARRGFYGASVEEISESAGFSRGAFYSNFTGKDEVFLALLDGMLEQQRSEEWGEILAAPGRAFGIGLEEGRTWYLLLTEFFLHAMRDEKAREKLAARYRSSRENFARFAERWYGAEGRELPMPADYLAWLLVAANHGLLMQAYLDPGVVPDDLADVALGYVLRGPESAKG